MSFTVVVFFSVVSVSRFQISHRRSCSTVIQHWFVTLSIGFHCNLNISFKNVEMPLFWIRGGIEQKRYECVCVWRGCTIRIIDEIRSKIHVQRVLSRKYHFSFGFVTGYFIEMHTVFQYMQFDGWRARGWSQ